ncbi:UNVERIFIED_ORG: hypothetical protein BTE55_12345 [Rhizobium sophorae]
MPRKRRRAKDRPDDLAAWSMIFQSGYDFFGDGADAGIKVDKYGRPVTDDVRSAWTELGQQFLDQLPDKENEPWAVREFGQPEAGRRRRRR